MTREERHKKIEEYYPLVELVVRSILSKGYKRFKQHWNDLISEGSIGLIKGVDQYREDGGASEVSYYSRKIKTHVLNYLRDFEGKSTPLRDIETVDFSKLLIEEEVPYVDPDYTLIDKYRPEHPIDNEIYERQLMGNTTNRELAEDVGVSRNAIILRKRKLKKKLRDKISKGEDMFND